MARNDGRKPNELRPVEIIRGYTENAAGSVLIRAGKTVVLCTACWEAKVPRWKEGAGSGWVTAEYDMLPGATNDRRNRNRTRLDGRTQEIQRLIGRSLRAVVDLEALGENSILIDCDVLQADGGTRTAAITGAYVALHLACQKLVRAGELDALPMFDMVAAISCGLYEGVEVLDLDYDEDSNAQADANFVLTAGGRIVEVQGTAEGRPFTRAQLIRLLDLARQGTDPKRFRSGPIVRRAPVSTFLQALRMAPFR